DIPELAAEIKAIGRIIEPILVRSNGDDTFQLVHGFRRMKAIEKLFDDNFKLKSVPAEIVSDSFDRKQELVTHLMRNNGKPLSSLEQGNVFKLLEEMGLSRKEIAELTSKTQAHIGNMLLLVNGLTKPVKDAINSGKIAATRALEIFRDETNKDSKKTEGIVLLAVEGAAKAGKSKATKQGGKRKPRKAQEGRPDQYTKVKEGVEKPGKVQLALFFHDCHEFVNSTSALERRMIDEILEVDAKGIYHIRMVDFKLLRERLEKEVKIKAEKEEK
ncbi:MAG: ParB N-terminal domain-containing protein, partial [Nanoarchaeota archaeon]